MEGKMWAAVLHAPGDLVYEQVDIPVPGENDVLIRVKACGVCGSDIPRVLTTGTYHFPTIPGHEFGGTVVETGKNVDPAWMGRHAAVIPLIPCRTCRACERGAFAQCEHYDFLGSRSDGGFAEYVKVPKDNLVFLPEGMNPETAAFLEPVSVALHVIQNNQVHFGDDVAVFGLGAIGIFVAQWAKAFGARHVFAVDLDPQKTEIAKKIGLTDAICGSKEDVLRVILEKTGQEGVDAAFEASGSGAAFNQALAILKAEGRLGLVGRPAGSLEIRNEGFEKILRKQLTIRGTWSFEFKRFPHHAWELALSALNEGKILTEPLISHRLPLENTMDAVRIMADKSEFFHKILIEP